MPSKLMKATTRTGYRVVDPVRVVHFGQYKIYLQSTAGRPDPERVAMANQAVSKLLDSLWRYWHELNEFARAWTTIHRPIGHGVGSLLADAISPS
jgi:hypothetical protein